jgi:hypothetical protein
MLATSLAKGKKVTEDPQNDTQAKAHILSYFSTLDTFP